MTRIFRNTILSAALSASALAALPAEAGDRWHGHDRQVVRRDDGDLVAAGILGLAAGAIVAGIIASGQQQSQAASANPYRHPRPQPDRDYFPPAPASHEMDYAYGPRAAEPWSREWYRYCEYRYRSFDPSTGTYIARGGERRFCVVD